MTEGREVLTQARLKELLDYDPETGVFTWKAEVQHGFPTCNTTSSALLYIKNNQPEKERA